LRLSDFVHPDWRVICTCSTTAGSLKLGVPTRCLTRVKQWWEDSFSVAESGLSFEPSDRSNARDL
jgi:hypothetical protein